MRTSTQTTKDEKADKFYVILTGSVQVLLPKSFDQMQKEIRQMELQARLY